MVIGESLSPFSCSLTVSVCFYRDEEGPGLQGTDPPAPQSYPGCFGLPYQVSYLKTSSYPSCWLLEGLVGVEVYYMSNIVSLSAPIFFFRKTKQKTNIISFDVKWSDHIPVSKWHYKNSIFKYKHWILVAVLGAWYIMILEQYLIVCLPCVYDISFVRWSVKMWTCKPSN